MALISYFYEFLSFYPSVCVGILCIIYIIIKTILVSYQLLRHWSVMIEECRSRCWEQLSFVEVFHQERPAEIDFLSVRMSQPSNVRH